MKKLVPALIILAILACVFAPLARCDQFVTRDFRTVQNLTTGARSVALCGPGGQGIFFNSTDTGGVSCISADGPVVSGSLVWVQMNTSLYYETSCYSAFVACHVFGNTCDVALPWQAFRVSDLGYAGESLSMGGPLVQPIVKEFACPTPLPTRTPTIGNGAFTPTARTPSASPTRTQVPALSPTRPEPPCLFGPSLCPPTPAVTTTTIASATSTPTPTTAASTPSPTPSSTPTSTRSPVPEATASPRPQTPTQAPSSVPENTPTVTKTSTYVLKTSTPTAGPTVIPSPVPTNTPPSSDPPQSDVKTGLGVLILAVGIFFKKIVAGVKKAYAWVRSKI